MRIQGREEVVPRLHPRRQADQHRCPRNACPDRNANPHRRSDCNTSPHAASISRTNYRAHSCKNDLLMNQSAEELITRNMNQWLP